MSNQNKSQNWLLHTLEEWLIIILALLILVAIAVVSANAASLSTASKNSPQAATLIEDDTNLR